MRRKLDGKFDGCKSLQEVVARSGVGPGSAIAVEFATPSNSGAPGCEDKTSDLRLAGLARKLKSRDKTISKLRSRVAELEKIIGGDLL